MKKYIASVNFNSHARVGRDHTQVEKVEQSLHFNSHARVGRDVYGFYVRGTCFDFNSHARVGRDTSLRRSSIILSISTHTPV